MSRTKNFGERFRVMQKLLNDATISDCNEFTLEKICEIANLSDVDMIVKAVNEGDEIPDIWIEQLVDTFGVNFDWLESGEGEYPFKSNLGRRFIPFDAMDILRWEYLSDIEEFIMAFGIMEGRLNAMIVRHKRDYCYEIYPHLYPFYSKVGASGESEILEFYRFLKYADRTGKLNNKARFIEKEKIVSYRMGSIAPLAIVNEPNDENFIDRIINLEKNPGSELLSDVEQLDVGSVMSIIRNGIENLEKINGEYDWNLILKNNPFLSGSDEKRFQVYVKEVEHTDDILTGIEDDSSDDEDDDEPYDVNNIVINTKSITAFQVEHWIERDMLDLSPEYQRNLVWDKFRKSALIESMMLNIPIPAFYLDEREDGVKTVVDGMQRLSTIHGFFSGEFKLNGLQYLHMYNGFGYNELNAKYRSRLEDTQLTMNILDSRCPEDAKFDVFCRVNTGGMPLNAQEVRNALSSRETRRLLKEMSEDDAFLKATLSRVSDARMGAQELCLRYICISTCFDWGTMQLLQFKGLKRTMDATVMQLNRESQEKKQSRVEEFHYIMEQCYIILGSKSFSRKDDPFKINKSILTAWAVCLKNMKLDNKIVAEKALRIRGNYYGILLSDLEFQEAVSKSTTQRKSIEYTIAKIREIIERNL